LLTLVFYSKTFLQLLNLFLKTPQPFYFISDRLQKIPALQASKRKKLHKHANGCYHIDTVNHLNTNSTQFSSFSCEITHSSGSRSFLSLFRIKYMWNSITHPLSKYLFCYSNPREKRKSSYVYRQRQLRVCVKVSLYKYLPFFSSLLLFSKTPPKNKKGNFYFHFLESDRESKARAVRTWIDWNQLTTADHEYAKLFKWTKGEVLLLYWEKIYRKI
jgi:hypothetical protein